MKIGGFLHVNIRCAPGDLPALEKFYHDALGLRAGYRPDFKRPGVWLYDETEPIIHISTDFVEGSIVKHRNHSGSVDHIAFRCAGSAEMRSRLVECGITFQEQNVENAGYQIFIIDPVGTRLEFNFPNSEAPNNVPLGTQPLK